MDREVWVRGAMVLSILVLVILILITPGLLGRPSSQLTSVPLLVIGMTQNESAFVVQLGWAIQPYQYDTVRLTINGSDPSVNGSFVAQDAYGLSRSLPGNATFSLHVYFLDQAMPKRNYFEYNLTAHAEKDLDNRTVIVFTFPYEKDSLTTEIRRNPPDDFQKAVPWRGTLP